MSKFFVNSKVKIFKDTNKFVLTFHIQDISKSKIFYFHIELFLILKIKNRKYKPSLGTF